MSNLRKEGRVLIDGEIKVFHNEIEINQYNEKNERVGLWYLYCGEDLYRKVECNYIDGKLNGHYMELYPSGAKDFVGTFKDGERHGLFYYYNHFNEIMNVNMFENGHLIGDVSDEVSKNGVKPLKTTALENDKLVESMKRILNEHNKEC